MRVCTQASPRWDRAYSAPAPAPPPPRLPCALYSVHSCPLPSALCPLPSALCPLPSHLLLSFRVLTSARCNDSWRRWPRNIEAHSPPLSAFSLLAQAPARGVSRYNVIVRRPPFGRHTPSVLPYALARYARVCRGSYRRATCDDGKVRDGQVRAVPVQMWQRSAQSRCRCGGGEPSPGADVAGVSPVPVQMWRG